MSTLSMHAALLRAPWQQRRSSPRWRLMAATPLLLAVPPVLLAWWQSLSAAVLVATLGIVWLTGMGWWMQVDGLLRQNRALLARMVPGHSRALRHSLLGQAALVTAAAVALLSLANPMPLRWLWVVAPSVVMLAWLAREPWLWLVFGILSPSLGELRRASLVMAALPLLQQVLALAVLAVVLAACVGQGGALHRHADVRQSRWQRSWRAMAEGRPAPATAQGAVERALQRLFDWPLRRWRDRVLAASSKAPLAARLDLGLGTGGQWTLIAWIGVLLAVTAVVILLWLSNRYDLSARELVDNGRIGLCIGLYAMVAGTLHSRLGQLWARRREQALLVLLPGTPERGDASDMEQHWRAQWLMTWAVVTGVLLAVGSFGSEGTVRFMAVCAAANLPLIWLTQVLQRRLRSAPRMLGPTLVPPLAAGAAALLPTAAVPVWLSLGLGALSYAGLAWWDRRSARSTAGGLRGLRLPLGRET